MPLSAFVQENDKSHFDLISTDLFDTVLLRDHTIESDRLAIGCRRAAAQLSVDPTVLARLRWDVHDSAYRAVAMQRPEGDASLFDMCRTMAAALGLGDDAANLLRQREIDVDIEHLRANRPLLDLLHGAARSGKRVIAVSDTYYDESDLRRIIDTVIGPHPFQRIYSSADMGLTKHAGPLFDEVARLENVAPAGILHVGDNAGADVHMAQAARWTGVHLPRGGRHRAAKLAGQAMSLPIKRRRAR